MSDIAAELELHTSTVSRTIAGKYLQTDRGVFALREFFDGGRIDAAPGEGQGRMGLPADPRAGRTRGQAASDVRRRPRRGAVRAQRRSRVAPSPNIAASSVSRRVTSGASSRIPNDQLRPLLIRRDPPRPRGPTRCHRRRGGRLVRWSSSPVRGGMRRRGRAAACRCRPGAVRRGGLAELVASPKPPRAQISAGRASASASCAFAAAVSRITRRSPRPRRWLCSPSGGAPPRGCGWRSPTRSSRGSPPPRRPSARCSPGCFSAAERVWSDLCRPTC